VKRRYLVLPVIIGWTVLFFAAPGPVVSSPLHQLTGFVHLGYFALLAWGLASLPSLARRPLPRQTLMVLAVVLAAGGAIELIQPYFGRSASWIDLGIDLLGGLIGMVFLAPARGRLSRNLLAGGQLTALTLTGLMFHGPVSNFLDMLRAERQFPVLAGFESRLEARRWSRGEIDRQLSRQGGASLRVELGTERYAGTTLKRSFGNWQGFSALCLSIYNPEPEPLRITISIRDHEHFQRGGRYDDRFNRSFHIGHGWNDIRIPVQEIETAPADRTLDLSRLSEVVIFTSALPEPRVMYLDHVRLIPDNSSPVIGAR
jgi:VanZ family protein